MVMAAGGGGGGSKKKPVALNPAMYAPYGGIPGGGLQPYTASSGGVAAGARAGALGGAAGSAPSPQDILNQIMGEQQTYPGSTDNTDYYAQAQQVYDPQMDYLAGLESSAKARAKASGKTIDEIYDELARSIGAQAGGISQSYDTATSQGNAAYNTAYADTKASFDNSRNGVADTLARLGIQEAAPNTTAQQSQMQALMQSIIGANGMAQNNAMVQGKQSALDYNTAMKSGATIRGGDAQANLQSQLNQFLNDLGGKKADLQSQIQQMAMQGKSDADKTAYERWRDQQQFGLERSKMGMQAGQYADDLKYKYDALAQKNSTTKQPDITKMDPVGELGAMASKMYGNPQAATNAVKAIMDTVAYANEHQTDSLQEFLAYLEERNQHDGHAAGDIGNLRALGTEYYRRMF